MQVRMAPLDTRALGEEQALQETQVLEGRVRQGVQAHRAPQGRPASQASRPCHKQCAASETCLTALDCLMSLQSGFAVPPRACRERVMPVLKCMLALASMMGKRYFLLACRGACDSRLGVTYSAKYAPVYSVASLAKRHDCCLRQC